MQQMCARNLQCVVKSFSIFVLLIGRRGVSAYMNSLNARSSLPKTPPLARTGESAKGNALRSKNRDIICVIR
jgi:hypothetical protein